MVRVGFIGAGQMAEALIKGLLTSKSYQPADIIVSDPIDTRLEYMTRSYGVQTTHDNLAVVDHASDVVVLAVKPQYFASVLSEVGSIFKPSQLVISIAAGVKIESISKHVPLGTRIIRVMPNTPCLVGETAAGFAEGSGTLKGDAKLVRSIITAGGGVLEMVPENLMDAVTGVAGSGPAYVYMMIEALADGGVAAGLPRPTAQALAAQMVYGTAKMVLSTGKHPGELKDAVCSPGGTTIQGVKALEDRGFRSSVINAVLAVTERSKELSKL